MQKYALVKNETLPSVQHLYEPYDTNSSVTGDCYSTTYLLIFTSEH